MICKPTGPLCNLRCEHCFYLDKVDLYPAGERFRMDGDVVESFVQQYIDAQPDDVGEVNFAWQGGEPTLMGLDFFRRVVALQKQHSRKGLRVRNALQTNGTLLTEAWGPFLREEEFLVGISVDGPPDLHDRYRVDTRGRGSLEGALRGLEVLQRHGVEYNTLTCVQSHNGNHPERIYRYLHGLGSRYMQFIPVVERSATGGLSERSVHPRQFGRFLNAVFDCWREGDVGEVFVQHFEMMLGIVMGLPPSLCVHAETCGRFVALEHNGDVFSCDHFVEPAHLLGNLTQTSLSRLLDSPQADRFGADKQTALPGYCRRCRLLRYCNGGCPAHRTDRAPGGEPGLNHLCEGYRLFYRHTLPTFEAMAECLRTGRPAREWEQRLARTRRATGATSAPRNSPCPCGSGRKFKRCCGIQEGPLNRAVREVERS